MPNDTKTLLSLTGSAVKDLVPVRLAATETISALFRFEVDAVAPGTIDPVTVLNQPACVHVNHGNTPTRHFHGIVSEFGPTGEAAPEGRHYRLVLVPQPGGDRPADRLPAVLQENGAGHSPNPVP